MLHNMSRDDFLGWWADYAVRRDQEVAAERRAKLISRAETNVENQLKRKGHKK
jgi:hypothetical protein